MSVGQSAMIFASLLILVIKSFWFVFCLSWRLSTTHLKALVI